MEIKKEISAVICYKNDLGKIKCDYITANSEKELSNELAKRENNKKHIAPNREAGLFKDWSEKWLREVKIPSGVTYNAARRYCNIVNSLNEYFGEMEIRKISLAVFQNYVNELAEGDENGKPAFAKASISDRKKVAKNIFQYARANNAKGVQDIFRMVTIPKNSYVGKRRSLTEKEQNWIIETEHDAQLPAMIMMFAGLRKGELLPLEWTDVDLDNALIYVNKSVTEIKSKPIVKEGGKSKSAVRFIPIPPILVNYLRNIKSKNEDFSKLVFPDPKGEIYSQNKWDQLWNDYMSILNIKYGYGKRAKKLIDKFGNRNLPFVIDIFTAHYLRHTFATLLYLEDIDVVTAKQILGHATISTTVNIYTDFEHMNRFNLSEEYRDKLKNEYAIGANTNFGFYSPMQRLNKTF